MATSTSCMQNQKSELPDKYSTDFAYLIFKATLQWRQALALLLTSNLPRGAHHGLTGVSGGVRMSGQSTGPQTKLGSEEGLEKHPLSFSLFRLQRKEWPVISFCSSPGGNWWARYLASQAISKSLFRLASESSASKLIFPLLEVSPPLIL